MIQTKNHLFWLNVAVAITACLMHGTVRAASDQPVFPFLQTEMHGRNLRAELSPAAPAVQYHDILEEEILLPAGTTHFFWCSEGGGTIGNDESFGVRTVRIYEFSQREALNYVTSQQQVWDGRIALSYTARTQDPALAANPPLTEFMSEKLYAFSSSSDVQGSCRSGFSFLEEPEFHAAAPTTLIKRVKKGGRRDAPCNLDMICQPAEAEILCPDDCTPDRHAAGECTCSAICEEECGPVGSARRKPVCGNGWLERDTSEFGTIRDEACDDGNNENGDGCSARCEVEVRSFCRTVTDATFDGTFSKSRTYSVCTVKPPLPETLHGAAQETTGAQACNGICESGDSVPCKKSQDCTWQGFCPQDCTQSTFASTARALKESANPCTLCGSDCFTKEEVADMFCPITREKFSCILRDGICRRDDGSDLPETPPLDSIAASAAKAPQSEGDAPRAAAEPASELLHGSATTKDDPGFWQQFLHWISTLFS